MAAGARSSALTVDARNAAFWNFITSSLYGVGGAPSVENLELRCRAHNLYEAERFFEGRLPLLRETRADYELSLSPTPIARSPFPG